MFSDNTAEIIDTLSRQTIFSVEGVILGIKPVLFHIPLFTISCSSFFKVSWSKKDALLSCAKADGSIEIINDASEVVCAVSQVEEVHPSVPGSACGDYFCRSWLSFTGLSFKCKPEKWPGSARTRSWYPR